MGSKNFTLLLILLSFHLTFTQSSTAMHPLCHEEEGSALLLFKRSFSIDNAASADDPLAYPKTASWNASKRGDGGGECGYCLWDGVECDPHTGLVIGLDLGSSCLHGSINSSSSLFHLVHLRSLNLAFNDFNRSPIPSGLSRLSRLTHLNLSHSSFSGQIPQQVLDLSQLVSLALWGNPSTMLLEPGLENLAQSLTSLQELHLSQVSIPSTVPAILANLTNLTALFLKDCGLHGEFPREIFHLPKLRHLSLRFNRNLSGLLPEFSEGSPLQSLELVSTGFYGELPDSIGNLNSLNWLDAGYCSFSGTIPASMANLTQLRYIHLSYNDFDSQEFPYWLGKFSQLTHLKLRDARLKGEIPSSLANLTQLSYLFLGSNQLTGQLPYWLANLTRLSVLDIRNNKLHGLIPDSAFQLAYLKRLVLFHNFLSGTVELDRFLKLENLNWLDLSYNKLSILTNMSIKHATSRKWRLIGLASCNLSKFPNFLRWQNELGWLNQGWNNLHGPIPNWFWNTSTETLEQLDLSFNRLTEFMQRAFFLPWNRLKQISLEGNQLQGFIPIPPPSTYAYYVGSNSFTGNLPPQLCNLTSLYLLDVSNNKLSGSIPPCFGNFNNNAVWMNYRGNNSYGTIPQWFSSASQLRCINLSQNQFRGQLPRPLANCAMLEVLDISNNQIKDVFPYWLGTLPSLKILVLRSNQFHGTMRGGGNAKDFPKLHIIDLSDNGFFGTLPAEYFRNWNTMKASNRLISTYMAVNTTIQLLNKPFGIMYSTKLTIKGLELAYRHVLDAFMVIDLSCNRFSGEIPKSIVDLKALHSLNLSNNHFRGPIPPFLRKLTELESLDLSHNRLSGQIPVELVQLTFLVRLNVSYNNLSGMIPHGKQFDTFPNTSYFGNLRLCGTPLFKQCGNSESSLLFPTTPEKDRAIDFGFEFDWVVISMGYLSGLVIGGVIGWTLAARKNEWFVETFGRKQQRSTKRRVNRLGF